MHARPPPALGGAAGAVPTPNPHPLPLHAAACPLLPLPAGPTGRDLWIGVPAIPLRSSPGPLSPPPRRWLTSHSSRAMFVSSDWSNGKAIWTKQRPMLDEVVLQNQVNLSTSSSLGQTVWVYRGSMWAYPWYTSVRKTLEDPAYSDWYLLRLIICT